MYKSLPQICKRPTAFSLFLALTSVSVDRKSVAHRKPELAAGCVWKSKGRPRSCGVEKKSVYKAPNPSCKRLILFSNTSVLTMTRNPNQITLISKETIKPSSPTPIHLKTYNLGELDLLPRRIYIPLVFFYHNYGSTSRQEIANQLKESLSQTLSQYYPFSGRLADGVSVDCNDEGVEFLEAEVDAPLAELVHLHEKGYQPIDQFFPTGGVWGIDYKGKRSLVLFQLSHFSCGGVAVAVSLSHTISDMGTLCSFVTHWANVSRQNAGNQVVATPPYFISSPKSNNCVDIEVPEIEFCEDGKCVTKKFVFPNSKLSQLKAMVKEQSSREDDNSKTMDPTRIEVLQSLLLTCSVNAAKANSRYSGKTFVLAQVVNLRKIMIPPLPETTVGNVCLLGTTTCDENELALNLLTARIRKMKMRLSGMTNSQVMDQINEEGEASRNLMTSKDSVVYWTSSYSRFPFYDVDFGWGKPIRVVIAKSWTKNVFLLMDTPSGDGIEALVSLDEEDMALFQNDEQIHAFAL